MNISINGVENCGGVLVSVTGELLDTRAIEVTILPYKGCPENPPRVEDVPCQAEDAVQ